MTITNPEAFAQWSFEMKLVEDLLRRVEQTERAILAELGYPTNPAAIESILTGEQPAPWPKRSAERAKRRALLAMHTLVRVGEVRMYLGPAQENARTAAYAALFVGALAGDVAIDADLGVTFRAKQGIRSRKGVLVKAEALGRRDEALRGAVQAERTKHPQATTRGVARALLRRFGQTSTNHDERTKAIDALRQRIARLER